MPSLTIIIYTVRPLKMDSRQQYTNRFNELQSPISEQTGFNLRRPLQCYILFLVLCGTLSGYTTIFHHKLFTDCSLTLEIFKTRRIIKGLVFFCPLIASDIE